MMVLWVHGSFKCCEVRPGDILFNPYFMAVASDLKAFAVVAIVMEVFFAIIYGFHQGYTSTVEFADFNGLIVVIYLLMLLLVGFGLVSTYLKEFALTGMTLNFIMVAFTIQWYFLMKKFWYAINLGDTRNNTQLSDNPHNIRLSPELHVLDGVDIEDMQFFTLSQAVASAIAMFVMVWPMLGRIGPGKALILCFVGNFFYTLNEVAFWRLNIADNGYGMKIFLFGSVAGLLASKLLGSDHTRDHPKYYSQYSYQSFALIGSLFVWALLPWLSVIDQSQLLSGGTVTTGTITTIIPDYRQVAPINVMFALCASAVGSFAMSILLHGKISVHEIIFSCFSGAIAYGSSSNVFPNPFPAMLIGFLVGILTTFLNSKVRAINANGVIDSLGGIFCFGVPALIGAIYSAILFASGAFGPTNTEQYRQTVRGRFSQGGMQMAGLGLVLGIALACGIIVGIIFKLMGPLEEEELFNDSAYIEQDEATVLRQSQVVQA